MGMFLWRRWAGCTVCASAKDLAPSGRIGGRRRAPQQSSVVWLSHSVTTLQ